MEKTTKKEKFIIIAVVAVVFLAWLCRMLNASTEMNLNPIRAVIYLVLYIFWGNTLRYRLVHSQVKHIAISIAALMVFWIGVRTIKYSISMQSVDLIRQLWYLFYLPMIFIPLLAFLMSMAVGLPEEQRLPSRYNLLWFPGALLVLTVLTNDLHQLVFAFPDNGMPWTDHDYSYGPLYYAIFIWMAGFTVATFVTLAVKSRRPGSRKLVLLPCVPVLLLLIYCVFYIWQARWLKFLLGDMTAFFCVMYMLIFELCIRCGLIRSNTGYGELFKAGMLGAQITDFDGNVRLSGADEAELSKEQIESAKEHPLLVDEHTLLKSKPIRYGHVFWRENVSELVEAIEQYEENCRDLEELSRIDREKYEADQTLFSLQEKNRASNLLHQETDSQIRLIDQLLARYDAEKDEDLRRQLLAEAAVVGAYIKRYGNLLLICEENEEADIADLARCFEESFLSLELLNVNCLCSFPSGISLKTKDMLRIYHTFEMAIEDCMFTLHDIWINGREMDEQVRINMEFVCDQELKQHASEADEYARESGTSRLTFHLLKGGA